MLTIESNFEFGDRVKDIVTGHSGVVTGIAKYITGCLQVCILPKSDGDKAPEGWLVIVKRNAVQLPHAELNGGPVADAPRAR